MYSGQGGGYSDERGGYILMRGRVYSDEGGGYSDERGYYV